MFEHWSGLYQKTGLFLFQKLLKKKKKKRINNTNPERARNRICESKGRRKVAVYSMSSSNIRDLQRELENKANDLNKLQKGNLFTILFHFFTHFSPNSFKIIHLFFRYSEESSSEKEVHYPTWRK